MPAFQKNHNAALHDIAIQLFCCHELFQISSREFFGKIVRCFFFFFCFRPIEKGRAFVSALCAGLNLNLLNQQGHSWKCWELPPPELVQEVIKVVSSVILLVSASLICSVSPLCCVGTVVWLLRAAH